MSNADLQDRVALVTGGSRGIGRAISQLLASHGARVAVNYRSDREAASETAAAIAQAGGEAMIVQGDVSNPETVAAMVAAVRDQLGRIELLVNNAGIFDFVDHQGTTLEQWQRTLDVNLTGTYLATWAVKEAMIEGGYGRIVNVASIAGLRARAMSIAYAVSKAGVIAFTKSVSDALAPHGIRINAVAPGLIETEILSDVAPSTLQGLIDATPIRRIGRPEEIAELVLFLLSERSSFTTGQTFVASGGRVLLP